MTMYRATFVRIDGENKGAKLHPTFTSEATDDQALMEEAAKALRAIPRVHAESWELKGYKPEVEKPKKARAPLLWEKAAEAVIESILDGEYTPGSHLPAPQRLSTKIGISTSSIYRAYNELRQRGWVSVSQQGTVVLPESAWPKDVNPPPAPEHAAHQPDRQARR